MIEGAQVGPWNLSKILLYQTGYQLKNKRVRNQDKEKTLNITSTTF